MIALPGGTFLMGSNSHYPEERPAHEVSVAPFEIDATTVTNAEFAHFVRETGYVTTAETPLDPASAPGMPPEYFVAGSLVFQMTEGPVDLRNFRKWWEFVPGADWQHPEGPDSDIKARIDHPVVQISLLDAMAYADWAGKSLPTEAEWEFAARDGAETTWPWGEDLLDHGLIRANTWHGEFPWQNVAKPPFSWPAAAGAPGRYRLFNMIGNVWEWTSDKYHSAHRPQKNCCTPSPRVIEGESFVTKGGSFLCAPSYCRRYRATARSPQEGRSSTNHLGFRCVRRS